MPNRANGRKKSNFPAQTTILGGATFDYVVNGVNYKISATNLIAALGATGTLQQAGDVTGTPVLDIQGSDNNIRNIESGPGVIASVSPENGITIEHNFTVDTTGAAVMINPTAGSPTIRSITGVSGVTVSEAGGVIQISSSATPSPSTTFVINQESDFPTQDATKITLDAGVTFIIGASFSTGKSFIVGDKSKITGNNVLSPVLTYTGVSPMFTSTDASLTIKEIQIDHPNSEGFNFTDTVGGQVLFINEKVRTVSGTKYGTFNNVQTVLIEGSSALDVDDGITLIGTSVLIFSIDKFFMGSTSATFKGVNLGSSISNTIEINSLVCTGPAGSIGITGVAASANVPVNEIATVSNCNLAGVDVALDTITVEDVRWQFSSNSAIPDTRIDGLLSMQSNATNTVISSTGVGVLVAGTWVVESDSQMTGTSAGRLTLDLERNAKLPITASVTIQPVSGGSQTMGARIAINGTVVANSLRTATASSGTPTSITLPWQEDLSPNDYVEVFVSNHSGWFIAGVWVQKVHDILQSVGM